MRRYLMRAIKELLSRERRAELRRHTRFISIIADKEESLSITRSQTLRGKEGLEHELNDSFFESSQDERVSNFEDRN